jgi:hypothetical protein
MGAWSPGNIASSAVAAVKGGTKIFKSGQRITLTGTKA